LVGIPPLGGEQYGLAPNFCVGQRTCSCLMCAQMRSRPRHLALPSALEVTPAMRARGHTVAVGSAAPTPVPMGALVSRDVPESTPIAAGWAARYPWLLGVDPLQEAVLFYAIAAMVQRGLPEGWSEEADEEGRVYFWNHATCESTWLHPDHKLYTAVVDLCRVAQQHHSPAQVLRQVFEDLEAEYAAASDGYFGPYYTTEGVAYWYDARRGISLWQDPIADVTRDREVKSGLVFALLTHAEHEEPASACDPSTEKAVVSIQRQVRCWLARRRCADLRAAAELRRRCSARATPASLPQVVLPLAERPERRRSRAARRLQRAWRRNLRRWAAQKAAEDACIGERVLQWRARRANAALIIQAGWRGFIERCHFRNRVRELRRQRRNAERHARMVRSAVAIQRVWRGVLARRRCRVLVAERRARKRRADADVHRNRAASAIQVWWRSVAACRAELVKRRAEPKRPVQRRVGKPEKQAEDASLGEDSNTREDPIVADAGEPESEPENKVRMTGFRWEPEVMLSPDVRIGRTPTSRRRQRSSLGSENSTAISLANANTAHYDEVKTPEKRRGRRRRPKDAVGRSADGAGSSRGSESSLWLRPELEARKPSKQEHCAQKTLRRMPDQGLTSEIDCLTQALVGFDAGALQRKNLRPPPRCGSSGSGSACSSLPPITAPSSGRSVVAYGCNTRFKASEAQSMAALPTTPTGLRTRRSTLAKAGRQLATSQSSPSIPSGTSWEGRQIQEFKRS